MTGYAQGGYTGPPHKYMEAGFIHPGEYLYRASDGTFWQVQQHPDGNTRTPLNTEDDE